MPSFIFVVSGMGVETFCIFIIFFFSSAPVPPLLEKRVFFIRGGFAQVQEICLYHNFVFTPCTCAAT